MHFLGYRGSFVLGTTHPCPTHALQGGAGTAGAWRHIWAFVVPPLSLLASLDVPRTGWQVAAQAASSAGPQGQRPSKGNRLSRAGQGFLAGALRHPACPGLLLLAWLPSKQRTWRWQAVTLSPEGAMHLTGLHTTAAAAPPGQGGLGSGANLRESGVLLVLQPTGRRCECKLG